MPGNRPSERRTLKKCGLLLLPLLVPGILGATALPAQAASASPTAAVHAAPATHVVSRAAIRAHAVAVHRKKIVTFAERFVGTPYVYGGTSRRGFDCSGFTQHVFAHFHVALPHSSRLQGRMGHRVAKKNARPGDLVVFGHGTHVGIYVGHHRFIDAPMPGRTIKVRSIYTHDYYLERMS